MNRRALTAAARISLAAAVVTILYLATTDHPYPLIDAIWDKAKHAAAFAVLALLADFSFPGSRFGYAKVLALLAYGVLIETIQYFISWRDASALDLVADAVGIGLYAACLPLLLRTGMLERAAKG